MTTTTTTQPPASSAAAASQPCNENNTPKNHGGDSCDLYMTHGKLQIALELYDFVNHQVLPGTNISIDHFWNALDDIVHDLTPRNQALLKKRDELQNLINQYHINHNKNKDNNKDTTTTTPTTDYKTFLQDIGYLLPPINNENNNNDWTACTTGVDPEITQLAGPQLVVPLTNARFALNAANARWGSLYNALYGTNVIPQDNEDKSSSSSSSYNPIRGQKVISYGRTVLNQALPLVGTNNTHDDSIHYAVDIKTGTLQVTLENGTITTLQDETQFLGYQPHDHPMEPTHLLFQHKHGLRLEIQIDRTNEIGSFDKAGICDIILEAAVTTIMDLEDSVATVDATDKVVAYKNWLGLLQGNLTACITKNDKTFVRSLNPDRVYTNPRYNRMRKEDNKDDDTTTSSSVVTVKGRSLLFVRNVGHLMTNSAILLSDGSQIFEGILDGMMTSLIALHDLKKMNTTNDDPIRNSITGSIYIVKPKMHGPEEVDYTNELFERIEDALKLPRYTIKLGIMDEERRTTINLPYCIKAARHRIVFINTGFLDRTGDEIHSSFYSGPMIAKTKMKQQTWIQAYEKWNVTIGIQALLIGHGQIGKGMWAIPDEMALMMKEKIQHLQSGANTAWVPSPTAATLHALHYHQIHVPSVQQELLNQLMVSNKNNNNKDDEEQKATQYTTTTTLNDILTIPIMTWKECESLTTEQIQYEVDNNCQGILGYVVRWITQGIGCSKVPNIDNIGLMEDRATLRISSQHLSNWLYHDIITKKQVQSSLQRMAKIVDEQNIHDKNYQAMAPDYEHNLAYQAAYNLIFQGHIQPNGYTEPLLHAYRLEYKKQQQKQEQQKVASATVVTTVPAEKDTTPKTTTTI